MLRRLGLLSLLALPLMAIAVYVVFLRVQAQLIERIALSVPRAAVPLSGLDLAVAEHVNYIWRNEAIKQQMIASTTSVPVEDFYMDKYEVTQRQYRKFLNWYALHADDARPYLHDAQPVDYQFANPHGRHSILGRLDVAAAGVSFYEAYAYCRLAGGNLPNRGQWFAAAAGKESRSYPWGEEFVGTAWRYSDPLLNLAAPVQQRAQNVSPDGIYDLGNGLSEWTLDIIEDGRTLLRGGNSYNRPYPIHALNFIERPAPLAFRSKYTGFRCVYPSVPQDQRASYRKAPWGEDTEVVPIEGGDYLLGISARHYTPKLLSRLTVIDPAAFKTFLTARPPQDREVKLSKYEISRTQYRSFLRDPFARLGFYANEKEPRVHSYVPVAWTEQLRQPDLPVVGIDWWSAYAFAKWAGGRLPTEREWLYAFGGAKRQPYPWGDAYQNGAAQVRDVANDYLPEVPLPIREALADQTASGFIAMAGNISEWTSSVTPYSHGIKIIVKGGNYRLPGARAAHYGYNAKVPPDHRSDVIGMRVLFN